MLLQQEVKLIKCVIIHSLKSSPSDAPWELIPQKLIRLGNKLSQHILRDSFIFDSGINQVPQIIIEFIIL